MTWIELHVLFFMVLNRYLRCNSLIRTIIFKWPWEYCSMTSRTSYGLRACCKKKNTRRTWAASLEKVQHCIRPWYTFLHFFHHVLSYDLFYWILIIRYKDRYTCIADSTSLQWILGKYASDKSFITYGVIGVYSEL